MSRAIKPGYPPEQSARASVVKRLAGRIFGFEQELEELRQQIRELSWDAPFGMWTRGAFLRFCHVMPRSLRMVAFIDLEDIKGLNKRYGYTEVDRRVKAMFSVPFRRSDVVARWYSGDEIVILFDSDRDGAERKMVELEQSACAQGLKFRYEIGTWEVGKQGIEEAIDQLSYQVVIQKP